MNSPVNENEKNQFNDNKVIDEMLQSPMRRRAFMARMGAAGLGVAAAGLFSGSLLAGCGGGNGGGGPLVPGVTPTPGGGGVFDQTNFPGILGRNINEAVLNFALTLEILEADLYRQALNKASGKPLDAPLGAESSYTLRISPGALSAASGNAAADAFLFLKQFTFIEAAHRDFLRAAIRAGGGTPQPPNPKGYAFPGGDPGSDLRIIIGNILPLEETGVRAYLGAAGFLTDLNLVQTAATIFSTEARHSAVLSDSLGFDPGPRKMAGDQQVVAGQPSENTLEYFLTPPVVIQRASAYFVK